MCSVYYFVLSVDIFLSTIKKFTIFMNDKYLHLLGLKCIEYNELMNSL